MKPFAFENGNQGVKISEILVFRPLLIFWVPSESEVAKVQMLPIGQSFVIVSIHTVVSWIRKIKRFAYITPPMRTNDKIHPPEIRLIQ